MMVKVLIDDYSASSQKITKGFVLFILPLLVLIYISGCAVGPDYESPKASLSNAWIDVDHTKPSKDKVNYGAWWDAFDDPVLNQLVAEAQQENLSLQIAALRVVEARAQLGVAKGSIFPQKQELNAQATRVGLSKNAANMSFLDRSFSSYQIGFDALWELDIWGRFHRGIEAAEEGYHASVVGYDASLVTVVAEVARAYTLFRAFEERLELALKNVNIQRESLHIADVRFRYGAVSELDVRQARALLHDTDALIPKLEIGIRQAKHALSTLIGRSPSELTDILHAEKAYGIPRVPANIAVSEPIDLLRRRPDVRRAELQAAAQSARIGVAESELYPRFVLLGSIGLASSEGGGIPSNGANLASLFSTPNSQDNCFKFLIPKF